MALFRLLVLSTLTLTGCNPKSDADSDGYSPADGDCNDYDADVYPGAGDTYGDGADQNCDGADGVDSDSDGVAGTTTGGPDCDDDDPDLGDIAEDADCDGILTADDCDDSDASSTAIAMDADCDGTTTASDCDDSNAASTTVATDADCDTVLTADDCDDNDAASTVVAEDADCDSTATADDCDDNDSTSTIVAEDADCDSTATADDCDDNDPTSTIVAEDADCDGITTDEDSREQALSQVFDSQDGTFTVNGVINPAGDRDFYAFDGEAGQAYGFWAQSYYLDDQVYADTVLRIWDETSTEPSFTNDDMPFRMWETDSAIFFEPTTTGTYYVEILDWSDWLDDEYPAEGGSHMEYSLYGFEIDPSEIEPNDEVGNVETWWVDANGDGNKDVGTFLESFADGYASFHGTMQFSGDNDLFPLEFDDDDKASWCQFGTWPDSYSIAPEFTLYNEYMEVVAQTDDPDVKSEWFAFYDAGITYRIPEEGGVFYLGVTDIDQGHGVGTFYSGMNVCWTYNDDPNNPGETLEPYEEETNDNAGDANLLELAESSNTPDYYYAWVYGNLEDQDPGDWLVVHDSDAGGSLDGKYLNVHLAAATLGSLLDPTVIVYSLDPTTGATTELATAVLAADGTDHDLEVKDLLLGAESQLAIEISGNSAAVDDANNWIALVTVYTAVSEE